MKQHNWSIVFQNSKSSIYHSKFIQNIPLSLELYSLANKFHSLSQLECISDIWIGKFMNQLLKLESAWIFKINLTQKAAQSIQKHSVLNLSDLDYSALHCKTEVGVFKILTNGSDNSTQTRMSCPVSGLWPPKQASLSWGNPFLLSGCFANTVTTGHSECLYQAISSCSGYTCSSWTQETLCFWPTSASCFSLQHVQVFTVVLLVNSS